jgi:DNA-binding SARP family transcriptional activator
MVEIRLFGALRVRRCDGSVVGPQEWRTSKTRDLMRILALRVDTVVSTERLVDALWPDVDPKHGAASLRTAVSRVRRTLGVDCIERRQSGLVLHDTWVDSRAFVTLADEARRRLADGELADGVRLAREALGLYVGDLGADEPYAAWLSLEREHLAVQRIDLLLELADASFRLGLYRDALAHARHGLLLQPANERAHRTVIRAHHRLGERGLALEAFERCRGVMVDHFGIEPSRATQSLHLDVLVDDPEETERPDPPLVARAAFVGELTTRLTAGQDPVVLTGAPGLGKTRMLEEVAAGWPGSVLRATVDLEHPLEEEVLGELHQAATRLMPEHVRTVDAGNAAPSLLVVDGLPLTAGTLDRLRDVPLAYPRVRILAATTVRLEGPNVLPLVPLDRDGTETLTAAVLGEEPAPALVDRVYAVTGGNPGRIVEELRVVTLRGELRASLLGVELVPICPAPLAEDAEGELERARRAMRPELVPVLDAAAVLGSGIEAAVLGSVLGLDTEEITSALDVLEDLLVLESTRDGYRFRHTLLRDAGLRWIRPSVRRNLAAACRRAVSEAERDQPPTRGRLPSPALPVPTRSPRGRQRRRLHLVPVP